MSTDHKRATRRRGLISAGAAVASLAALASVSTAVATATTIATKKVTPKVSAKAWGSYDGQTINLYTLRGAGGMVVEVSQFGADIQSINVPDKNGKMTDVSLGFRTLNDYISDFTQGDSDAVADSQRHR